MAEQLRVLIVGVDSYAAGSVTALRGCAADAAAMQAYFTRQLGVPLEQVRVLVNEAATRAAVLQAWQEHLIAQAAPGVQLFFHYSGHGSQAPSIDPNEPDRLDETLVVHDSRQPGSYDILDKELGYLIRAAEAKGAQVSVLLDCCHSGSGTRAGDMPRARLFKPMESSQPRPPLLTPTAALLAAMQQATSHVLLAAARDNELANEYQPPDGGSWRGAVTYFFLESVRSLPPTTTWGDVHDLVLARVHTIYPQQTPQLEGPAAQILYGGQAQPLPGYLRVLDAQGSSLRVDGGAPLGLAVGAQLAVFAPGASLSTKPLAEATVTRVEADQCWAQVNGSSAAAPGARVEVLSYGYADQVHRVAVDDAAVRAALAVLRSGQPSPFLQLAAPGQTPELTVQADGGNFVIADATGRPLAVTSRSADGAAARVAQQLEHLALFRNVLALRNPSIAAALREAVQVSEPQAGGTASSSQTRTVRDGQRIDFTLTNSASQRLLVTVLRLGPDYSIRRLFPVRGRAETLAPGRAGALRVTDTAFRSPQGGEPQQMIYKIFAFVEESNLDVLELPALDQAAPQPQPAVRAANPLSYLLNSVRWTATRPFRPASATVEDKWWVTQVEVQVIVASL